MNKNDGLLKKIIFAYRGRATWKKIKNKYGRGECNQRFILFPGKDDEYNAWGMYYLKAYIEYHHYDGVVVLAYEKKLIYAFQNIVSSAVCIEHITEQEMRNLIQYYALVDINSEMRIISVTEPYDTNANKLIGKNGITKREIVRYDIFKIEGYNYKELDCSNWIAAEDYQKYLIGK